MPVIRAPRTELPGPEGLCSGFSAWGHRQDLGSLSVLHRVEEVQGPWACRCYALYFLPGPLFWRLPQAPQSSLGAQEGSLRDAGQAPGGRCGLPLAGTPGCGSSGRCPVGTEGGWLLTGFLVSDTRTAEMRRQPPRPGTPQQGLQLPYSPSGGVTHGVRVGRVPAAMSLCGDTIPGTSPLSRTAPHSSGST